MVDLSHSVLAGKKVKKNGKDYPPVNIQKDMENGAFMNELAMKIR